MEYYDAFEIDKYAITVSEKNYPNIVHHGDVFEGDFTQFKGYDLLFRRQSLYILEHCKKKET